MAALVHFCILMMTGDFLTRAVKIERISEQVETVVLNFDTMLCLAAIEFIAAYLLYRSFRCCL